MKTFQISNRTSGQSLGAYQGEDGNGALNAMARDAGYGSVEDMKQITRRHPELKNLRGPEGAAEACDDLSVVEVTRDTDCDDCTKVSAAGACVECPPPCAGKIDAEWLAKARCNESEHNKVEDWFCRAGNWSKIEIDSDRCVAADDSWLTEIVIVATCTLIDRGV